MSVPGLTSVMVATLALLEAEQKLLEAADAAYKALVASGDQDLADRLYQVLAGLRRVTSDCHERAMLSAESAPSPAPPAETGGPPPAGPPGPPEPPRPPADREVA